MRDGEVAEAVQVQVQAGGPRRGVKLLKDEPGGKIVIDSYLNRKIDRYIDK